MLATEETPETWNIDGLNTGWEWLGKTHMAVPAIDWRVQPLPKSVWYLRKLEENFQSDFTLCIWKVILQSIKGLCGWSYFLSPCCSSVWSGLVFERAAVAAVCLACIDALKARSEIACWASFSSWLHNKIVFLIDFSLVLFSAAIHVLLDVWFSATFDFCTPVKKNSEIFPIMGVYSLLS